VLVDLIRNFSLLVMLAVGLQLFEQRMEGRQVARRVAVGLLFGLVGVVGMLTPVRFAPGVIYDGRSIILSLAGLFGGAVVAAVAAVCCALYRFELGGAGALAGVAVIVESAVLGVVLRYLRSRDERWVEPVRLLGFGVVVHAVMLVLQILLLPGDMGWKVARDFGGAILVCYPLAFLLTAHVFLEGEQRRTGVQALAQSEQRYRSFFEQNEAMMLVVDPSAGRLLAANPAACRFHGWSHDEMTAKSVFEINTLGAVGLQEEFTRAREQGRHHFLFRHRLADGSERDLELFVTPMRRDDRDVTFAVLHDVTARRAAEEALRGTEAERARLAAAVEQMAEMVVVTSADGAIEYVNPAFEAVTGYRRDEVLGKNPRFLKSGRQDATHYATMWRTISSGRVFKGRMVNRRKDGTTFTEDATISPVVGADGAVVEYVAVKTDVTDLLALEEQYRHAQKMEAVGQLAGGVAHDFNNILQAILGYAQLLLDDADEHDVRREDLNEILKGAERAATLTRQLLAFSRQQVMQPRLLDVNELVKNLMKMIHRVIGEDIDVVWSPGTDPGLVRADAGMLEQALMNLVVNARDAMPSGGTLTIATERALVGAEQTAGHEGMQPGPFVVIVVGDTGCGMSETALRRAFEPFFTTKATGKGTGLGLATVYGIAQQHGGAITAESAPGQGAPFRLYPPVHEGQGVADACAVDETPVDGGTETILLAEDDTMVRTLAETILCRAGYRVVVVEDGQAAVDTFTERPDDIDLVLLDVIMPRVSGGEALERMRRLRPEVPAIFSSGYSDDAIQARFVLHEGVRLIKKPYAPRTLLAAVRAVLDGERGVGAH